MLEDVEVDDVLELPPEVVEDDPEDDPEVVEVDEEDPEAEAVLLGLA